MTELEAKRTRKETLERQINAAANDSEAERAFGADYARACDDVETLTTRLLNELATFSNGGPGIASTGVVGNIHSDARMNPMAKAIGDALYARMSGKAPEGQAREFMGQSLLQMGAALLEARGERVGWLGKDTLADQIMRRSFAADHTTSDFPTLLTSAGNRVLLEAYKAAQTPLKLLARPRTASDFRSITLVKLGEAPKLDKIGESGEVKHGSRAEAKEGFKVSTFAKIFGLSRTAIINDDLGAFSDVSMAWGKAAAETEADELVALLTANAGAGINLDDNSPLYGTARGNKANAGAALGIATLGAGRQAMRDMKGLDGITPISATPKHLLVGSALETTAEQVLASIYAATVGDANPFANRLQLHVEPRLTGNAWRLFADPAELAVLTYAYLSGSEGPLFQMREGWDTLGFEYRCILDFGCGVQDWRGTYLNPGA